MKPPPTLFWRRLRGALAAAGAAARLVAASAGEPAPQTAAAVLQRWHDALGGQARLAALAMIDTRERFQLPNGSPIDLHIVRDSAGRYRIETGSPQRGLFIEASDGKYRWISQDRLGFGLIDAGTKTPPMRPEEIWFAVLLDRLSPQQTLVGEMKIAGQPCSVVELKFPAGNVEKWFFGRDSGQLVRVDRVSAAGPGEDTVTNYSDFRRVNGLTLPFYCEETTRGKVTAVRRLTARVDAPLPAKFFTPTGAQLREAYLINSILKRHLDSLGGWQAAEAIRTRVTHLGVNVTTSGTKSRVTISQQVPDLIMVDNVTSGIGRSRKGFNGTLGWVNSEIEGYRQLDDNEIKQLIGQADLMSDVRLAQRGPLRRFRGTLQIGDRATYAVSLGAHGADLGTFYFDQANGRLLRVAAVKIGDEDSSLTVTSDFSDFHNIDGVDMPFTVTTTNPAVQFITTIESVTNNVVLDPAISSPSAMIDLYELTRAEVTALFAAWELSPAHGARLWRYLYWECASSLAEMTALPAKVRARLAAATRLGAPPVVRETPSSDGFTRKFLLALPDERVIETVLMRYTGRATACVSSQAGCAMGCVFCATGQNGFGRHLTAGEIVAQAVHVARLLRRETPSARLRNLVLMGMGEPLHNYDAVMKAVDILRDPSGLSLGAERITLSTVGVIPGILRLAAERRPVHLAVSLHSADQQERAALVPVAKTWPLADLLAACRAYSRDTGRRIFYEWTLIEGRNDSPAHARAVGRLLKGLPAQVNLIPLNPTVGYAGLPSRSEAAREFQRILADEFSLPSTVRQRRGIDIAAGCGQLAGAA